MEQKKPYPVFIEPGVLTDDSTALLHPTMTVGEFDRRMGERFVRNLEVGNRIIKNISQDKQKESD